MRRRVEPRELNAGLPIEDVCRAAVRRVHGVTRRADDDDLVSDRHRRAEARIRSGVFGDELEQLRLRGAIEEVDCTRASLSVHGSAWGADRDGDTAHVDGGAEAIADRTVVGDELREKRAVRGVDQVRDSRVR